MALVALLARAAMGAHRSPLQVAGLLRIWHQKHGALSLPWREEAALQLPARVQPHAVRLEPFVTCAGILRLLATAVVLRRPFEVRLVHYRSSDSQRVLLVANGARIGFPVQTRRTKLCMPPLSTRSHLGLSAPASHLLQQAQGFQPLLALLARTNGCVVADLVGGQAPWKSSAAAIAGLASHCVPFSQPIMAAL